MASSGVFVFPEMSAAGPSATRTGFQHAGWSRQPLPACLLPTRQKMRKQSPRYTHIEIHLLPSQISKLAGTLAVRHPNKPCSKRTFSLYIPRSHEQYKIYHWWRYHVCGPIVFMKCDWVDLDVYTMILGIVQCFCFIYLPPVCSLSMACVVSLGKLGCATRSRSCIP